MGRQSRFVPENLSQYIARLRDIELIKALRRDGNDQRADIIIKMVRQFVGETIIDEGYRIPGKNHQIYADLIEAVDQLEALLASELHK